MQLANRSQVVKRRTDVEDDPPGRLEMGQGRLRQMKRAFEIDIDDGPEPVRRKVLRQAEEIGRRAVHEDIQPTERRDGLANRRLNCQRVPNVL